MRKEHGFKEEKTIVLPATIIKELQENDITSTLLVSDIGYYPRAKHHYRERKKGCNQHILLYCIQGEGWIEIEGKRLIVKSDQYIIISAGTPHRYGSNNQHPWSIYWIHFCGTKSHLFINYPNKVIDIDSSSSSRFNDRIFLFNEIYHNYEMGYSMDNLAYANICLWHMLGSLRYLPQFRKIKEIDSEDIITKSRRFIRDHLDQKISLSMLAEHCNYSVSQFCSVFKSKTSRTPLNFITYIKIQQASRLLDFSDLRINEISRKVGYEDSFYFSRVFSKIMGMSPKTYRNLKKG